MSSLATNVGPAADRTVRPGRAAVAAAAVFSATALFDLIARPPLGDRPYHAATAYTFTALLIPFALGMFWVLTDLRAGAPAGSRLATAGFRIAAIGLLLFLPCAAASLATSNPQALGPAYGMAMLLSLVGIGMLSAGLARAGALSGWAAVALPLAWLFGGPAGEGGKPLGFRGAALILAVVSIAVARTKARRVNG